MQQNEWDVIVLKPTPVFLSFLSAQVQGVDLPDLRLLQTDTTAYVMRKQRDDESTLNEIERHFSSMFRHEIRRWLGDDAFNPMEASFLDFLCCFKFEMHSQIILMEPSMDAGSQLLCIKPRSILLKWMQSTVEEQEDLATVAELVNLRQLCENATVVIKNFRQLSDIRAFLETHYRTIMQVEMSRMCDEASLWPTIDSYQSFSRHFAVDVHTQLIHLH